MQSDVETFPTAALGYRIWKVKDQQLMAVFVPDALWNPGVNTARCDLSQHSSPQAACSCGLYAYHTLAEAEIEAIEALSTVAIAFDHGFLSYDYLVIGAIAGRGDVEIHAGGFRCQQAQILGLYCPSDLHFQMPTAETLKDLSQKYNVPFYTGRGELLRNTKQLLNPMPARLIPHLKQAPLFYKTLTVLAATTLFASPSLLITFLALAVVLNEANWLWGGLIAICSLVISGFISHWIIQLYAKRGYIS